MTATELTYKDHIKNQNNCRIKIQEKLYDYYICDHNDIMNYLDKALSVTFDVEDIKEFQKDYVNITRKCINQLAIVYKEPATRSIIINGKVNDEKSKEYNAMLPVNVNTIDKMAHRYAKLLNTSLTRVKVVNSKLVYEVLPSHLYDIKVDENDPYKLTELSYEKYFKNKKGEDELFRVYWTDEQHYRRPVLNVSKVSTVGDEQPIGDKNKKMVNPYKIIPYAACRLEEQGDYWGTGLCDLVNANEQINFLLTDLINGSIMQSWGTPVLINFGLSQQKSKVRIGPKHPLTVDGRDAGDPVDFKYANANAMIREMMDHVDWKIKLIALSKGLNPNSFLQDVKATSGYSKIVDSLEQLEIRRDDIEPCRQYEDRRFEITRAVVNYHANLPDKGSLKKIDEKSFLKTDFAEITIPLTVDEQIKQDEFDLDNNLISIIDLAKRKNPDLNNEEIIDTIMKNQQINEKYLQKKEVNAAVPAMPEE